MLHFYLLYSIITQEAQQGRTQLAITHENKEVFVKKFLSWFLSLVTLLSLSTPVLATESYPISADQAVLSKAEAMTLNLVPTETDTVY